MTVPEEMEQNQMYLNGHDHSPSSRTPSDSEESEDDSKTNLIVNYLPQDMTEEELRTLFSSVGILDSCKLIRDKITKASLGYAFVNFQKPRDSINAIETLHGMKLNSKTIKVSFARPSSNEIKNANLYISGLPQTCKEDDLRCLFHKFGEIITCKVLGDENGESRGVGFVRFDKRQQAQEAIDELNNSIPSLQSASKPLNVKFANPPSQKTQNYMDILSQTKGGLATNIAPRNRGIYTSIATGAAQSSPTSAFGNASPIAAVPQTSTLNDSPVPSYYGLTSGVTSTSPYSVQPWCIFVYNLPSDATDLTLFQLFSKYGAIYSVKVIVDQEKKCKGYGFVNMINYEDAVNSILHLNNYCLERSKPLQVSFKKPKGLMT